MHGTYKGPIGPLRGKGALLRLHETALTLYWCQFDDMALTWGGERLGQGWHAFPRQDFLLDPEPAAEDGK